MEALTAQLLANVFLDVLKEDEAWLATLRSDQPERARSTRTYEEKFVQYLAWKKLLSLGYDVQFEEDRVDLTTSDGVKIEMKGPWNARNGAFPTDCACKFRKDIKKLDLCLTQARPVRCFSVVILHGADEARLCTTFKDIFRGASLEFAARRDFSHVCSDPMELDVHQESASRVQRVFVTEMLSQSAAEAARA